MSLIGPRPVVPDELNEYGGRTPDALVGQAGDAVVPGPSRGVAGSVTRTGAAIELGYVESLATGGGPGRSCGRRCRRSSPGEGPIEPGGRGFLLSRGVTDAPRSTGFQRRGAVPPPRRGAFAGDHLDAIASSAWRPRRVTELDQGATDRMPDAHVRASGAVAARSTLPPS